MCGSLTFHYEKSDVTVTQSKRPVYKQNSTVTVPNDTAIGTYYY